MKKIILVVILFAFLDFGLTGEIKGIPGEIKIESSYKVLISGNFEDSILRFILISKGAFFDAKSMSFEVFGETMEVPAKHLLDISLENLQTIVVARDNSDDDNPVTVIRFDLRKEKPDLKKTVSFYFSDFGYQGRGFSQQVKQTKETD